MQMHKNCHRTSNLIHCFCFNLRVFIQTPIPSHSNSIIMYMYKRKEWKTTKVTKWLSPSQPLDIFWLHILQAALWYIHFFNDAKNLHWKLTDCQNAEALLLLFRQRQSQIHVRSYSGIWNFNGQQLREFQILFAQMGSMHRCYCP